MNNIKFLILSFLTIFAFSFITSGQAQKFDVGVDEQLDSTIPMELEFYNEKNEKVKLKDLINKPTVLSFVYFDCPGMCSPLLNGVSDVIDKSDLQLGADYDVITISFNRTDSPEKAVAKKENFAVRISKDKAQSWYYLTGDSSAINAITRSVGYKFKQQGLDFAHPSVIVIVSPEGKITRYLYGVYYVPFDFKMSIIDASKGFSRPTTNRILEYCFSYDPVGKGYVMNVTKIVATLMIFLAVIFLAVLIFKKKSK